MSIRLVDVRGRVLLLACALIALPALAGCSTNPVTGRRELVLISGEQEVAMGLEAAPKFEEEFGGRVPNAQLQQYVQAVGQRVAAVSDRPMPYSYTLVASDVPNAFALPGGSIFITAGLMRRMMNEQQLAAVLAHETVHVAARHSVQGMQQQMGASVLVELAGRIVAPDKADAAQAVAKVVTSMGTLKYSRNDEYEADQVGIKYAARAGYNPWGMVELLTVLKSLSEKEPGTLSEMFMTHPLSSKRIEEAQQTIQADPAYAKWSASTKDPAADKFTTMRALLPPEAKK
ncbi:MAG: M48 family metalloprotease [Planctomycetes bacterium]|nr:M48 family metalloprotease [Planctomycetota bacterium]